MTATNICKKYTSIYVFSNEAYLDFFLLLLLHQQVVSWLELLNVNILRFYYYYCYYYHYYYRCETPLKKELEDSQDTSEKGPDIIPFANETEGNALI